MLFFGIIIGVITLFIIGLGFPMVIHVERRFGYLWWPYLLILGILLILVSQFMRSDWLSVILAILGASLAWASTELKEQAIRAELGWFPFYKEKILPPFSEVIRKWKTPNL